MGERETGKVFRIPADGGTTGPRGDRCPTWTPRARAGCWGWPCHPLFIHDSFIYAYLTAATDNRIVRFRLIPEDTAVADLQVLVDGIHRAGNHDGGGLAFGPDGMLYAGTGDAGVPEDAQDVDSLNGKILRMTPVGVPAPDNPIPGSYVYSWGHRNVQGLAWDSRKRLWATEFGQDEFDEVNLIRPAHNYGWPEVEGIGDTAGGRFTNPEVTWSTGRGEPLRCRHRPRPERRHTVRSRPARGAALAHPGARRGARDAGVTARGRVRPAADARAGLRRQPVDHHQQPGRPG